MQRSLGGNAAAAKPREVMLLDKRRRFISLNKIEVGICEPLKQYEVGDGSGQRAWIPLSLLITPPRMSATSSV